MKHLSLGKQCTAFIRCAEKKYIFFHRGKTVEAASVHQTEPTTTSDSLQNLQSAMLKTAFSNINPIANVFFIF
jgi:hypothetical protein